MRRDCAAASWMHIASLPHRAKAGRDCLRRKIPTETPVYRLVAMIPVLMTPRPAAIRQIVSIVFEQEGNPTGVALGGLAAAVIHAAIRRAEEVPNRPAD